MDSARFVEILELLAAHEVEFIVVGMTAGILQGVPLVTIDLDIVHRRTPENVAHLLQALQQLDAIYRHDSRNLRPKESHLISPGHQLLRTIHGDLDCLGTIAPGGDYETLLASTVEVPLAEGTTVKVLSLPALIEAKASANRPKDVAVLPVLRATLDEINRRSG
jgi:hypothetical protein